MSKAAWASPTIDLSDDRQLGERVAAIYQDINSNQFLNDPLANQSLGVEVRALRRIGDWRVLLILTPWMLARLSIPDRSPEISLPTGWDAETRRAAEYLLLGPTVPFDLLGQHNKAHLNYHPILGHYLIQPLILNMTNFTQPADAYEAWNRVITTRNRNMQEMQRDCPLQKEISRREFFTRLR